MGTDWLNLDVQGPEYQTLTSRLDASPFEDLVEIDLINDRCRNLYHIEGKYFVPIMKGSWSELFHYCADHMVHPQDRAVYVDMMDPDTICQRMKSAATPGVLSREFRYRAVDGAWLWIRQVAVYGEQNGLGEGIVRCYIYDINTQKLREQGRLAPTASSAAASRRDDLTGLLLDREFFDVAQRKLPALSGKWCVMALDIENFKLYCDWYGQQVGHFLLAEIGEILQREERETGGLAGYRGQDDFAMLYPYDIKRINRLFDEIQGVVASQGDAVGFKPIFGICLIEGPNDEIMAAYNHAAMTAEQIKGDFRNRIRVYSPTIHEKNTEEYRIISRFQQALDNNEIFFCLQPQCRVSTGNVVGAESLARWRTSTGRMIPPTRFVPILEKYGMVTNLDKFIWEEVCRWLRRWIDGGHQAVPISMNVSQIDVFSIDVPAHFSALLEKYSLPADLIKIEITESAYVEDTAMVRETVRRLRSLGFLVLMDDFGSGYSSLNMLHSLNVDILKLDAQFLHIDEGEVRKGLNILESIISMAKTMTLPIIVEGVETQEQINFLSDLGCRYMQGYYFYRPMPVEEFENLIRDGKRIDPNGFEFKANSQFHTREFLDENVFSDVMLNNILGAVAIFRWNGESLDIVRYNQQYYQMCGIELNQLEQRRTGVLSYFYPDDVSLMEQAMKRAASDRVNGARCVVRVYKPNGTLGWYAMQMYFMEQNEQGTLFYCAVRDVTELQYVNTELPGGYFRCAADGTYAFYFISQGFEDMVGYTAEEIRDRFDNCLINMVHRDDRPILEQRLADLRRGNPPSGKPFRIKRRDDGYIYVVNQSRLVDIDGQMCVQNVSIDVTEVMKLRNQMRLLSRFISDDVVFVRRKSDGSWKYRVVIHGLEDRLGLTGKAFEKLLNSGDLYRNMSPEEARRLGEVTMNALKDHKPFEFEFNINLQGGRTMRLHMKNSYVSDKSSKVEYICVFREA